MSLLSLLTKKAPTLGSGELVITFDAVIEDTLEAAVMLSDYPIEVGSVSNDHRVKLPIKWTLTGGISNNPVKLSATDFTGALSEIAGDNGLVASSAGLMAGWLSTNDETRSSESLKTLMTLMYEGDPFDVDAGDIQLSNMVIESIRRTKDAGNENGLIFVAGLREWQDITISASFGTVPDLTQDGASALTDSKNKGQKLASDVSDGFDSAVETVTGWFA